MFLTLFAIITITLMNVVLVFPVGKLIILIRSWTLSSVHEKSEQTLEKIHSVVVSHEQIYHKMAQNIISVMNDG